jgi:hypothetical protein
VRRATWIVAAASLVAVLALVAPAAGANECDGLQVCVPIAGPWVVVPSATGPLRSQVSYQMTCPRNHIAGGLDAQLSQRAIDVGFQGTLGSPVNPGISTARSVVFTGLFVGVTPRAPTFKPLVGCIPATGGGGRVPTSVGATQVFPPGMPSTRRVNTVRVRPGASIVHQGCLAGERLVGASHAFAFDTRQPPSQSLVSGVSGRRSVSGGRVVVRVSGDAEIGTVRALVQVHAVCSRQR